MDSMSPFGGISLEKEEIAKRTFSQAFSAPHRTAAKVTHPVLTSHVCSPAVHAPPHPLQRSHPGHTGVFRWIQRPVHIGLGLQLAEPPIDYSPPRVASLMDGETEGGLGREAEDTGTPAPLVGGLVRKE